MTQFIHFDYVLSLLNEDIKRSGLHLLLEKLLASIKDIGNGLRNGSYSNDTVGTQNSFGDNQLDVDLKTDAVIMQHLRESGVVAVAASEENPVEIDCGGNEYSVSFDPLDGSSVVDANFAVGTIVGIFPGRGLINRVGREQHAALMAIYGPRVTVALALNSTATVSNQSVSMELTLKGDLWVITNPQFQIRNKAKTFAPGNLRATVDNPKYNSLVQYWISNKYTLRYTGGMVPDVYHILCKGEGVMSNASSPSAKAKLRLLFEATPIALIIEAAGGLTCVCASEAGEETQSISLLDVVISDLDKRVGVCYGSAEEVERFRSFIF